MIEALWSVEFGSSVGGFGSGVAVFETGRVLGGDSAYLYVGNYKTANGVVHSEIQVTKYNDLCGMQSVFGPLKSFNLKVSGNVVPMEMVFTGVVVEQPQLKITIKAVRRAELP